MNVFWRNLISYMDAANRYLTFKIARTVLISTVLMLMILLVRKILDGAKDAENSLKKLYFRACLWTFLLPVPFLGALKISEESYHWRNYIYVFVYKYVTMSPIPGWIYMAGMFLTALWFVIRRLRLGHCLKQFKVCDEYEIRDRQERIVRRTCIRINPMPMTPFTTGIFRHTIVLPEYIVRDFSKSEVEKVLKHEYNHIKRGHLIWYAVIEFFRVIWFINPLVHICAAMVKDDLEMICDNVTIRTNDYAPGNYGMLLIKSMKYIEKKPEKQGAGKATPAFAAERSFRVMKKRIRMIAGYREHPNVFCKAIYGVAVLGVLAVFILGRQLSYPSYTPYEGFSLYRYDGKQAVFQDEPEFDSAVTMTDSGLSVNNNKVKKMLEEDETICEAESYWIYYGGYMKMPGIGGGGNVVAYYPYESMEDTVFIPYNSGDVLSDVLDWLFKHI